MKRLKWQRLHRWIGLPICLILALFALSGIVLNHRSWWASADVSRAMLPSSFRYQQWNQGLLRGTLPMGDSLLIYGSGGVFLADSLGQHISDYNQGLPASSDHRQVRALVEARGQLYLATLMGIYTRETGQGWQLLLGEGKGTRERFTDLIHVNDTLYALSRSQLYLSAVGEEQWQTLTLRPAQDDDGKVSAFRLLWLLHSGELFGLGGQLVVDAIGLVLLLLSVTGILHFLFPHLLRRIRQPQRRQQLGRYLRSNVQWHDRIGRTTFGLALLVILTGWMLRPPLLIALAQLRIAAPPFTTLDSDNPWHDRLRMLRYDERQGDWLFSTSSGFYSLSHLHASPQALSGTPRVSPMGVNVWERGRHGEWLIGSFSGFYAWERKQSKVLDALTGATVTSHKGAPPLGAFPVSGYSSSLHPSGQTEEPLLVTYDKGTAHLPQPQHLATLPMSLWNLALEVHTGRIFTFLPAPDMWWIFVTGLLSLLVLLSGWKLRRKRSKKQSSPPPSRHA